ncbi:MAG TPA: chorismate synthase [Candidatus Binatia bacterium]|nr:chorismate synthase [Candidatus Binatia bacterium]
MLRFFTAGESHGPALTAIVEGFPAGVAVAAEDIDRDLARRQQGYGRGGRMKIERDEVQFRSGIRFGETLGSPITLVVENRDWRNWTGKMSPLAADRDPKYVVTRPRPGHADLTGALKYDRRDVRDVLERASARETTMRVAIGALAKCLLRPLGVEVRAWVSEIGNIRARHEGLSYDEIFAAAEKSEVRLADLDAERRIIALVDECKKAGDTLGGVVEVVATGLPPGLGSHVHYDRKLDGRLGGALLSLQAAKGVEIGIGFEAARRRGSQAQDEIAYDSDERSFRRVTNFAGGTEGGMSNGAPLIVRVAFKPLSTLMSPLASVDLHTKEEAKGAIERSDVMAIPAAAVIAEAVVAFELARVALEKFGGDSLREVLRNRDGYLSQVREA